VNYQPRFSTEAEAFKVCFSGIAAFLGRPSAPTVLFSGVPLGPGAITFEEIEFLANRIGLEGRIYARADFTRHRVELPAIVFFADRAPVALLSEQNRFEFLTVPQDGGRTTFSRKEVLEAQVTSIVGLSLTYANTSEEAKVGTASTIERRHWLTGTLAPFWRSYIRVALAACFINLIALGSPLFTMNVYDRILPNKAVSSLWVLAIGVSISILFDLLLKSAGASMMV
jgi:ATP-binding cassette subfamily C protein LapB